MPPDNGTTMPETNGAQQEEIAIDALHRTVFAVATGVAYEWLSA